MGNDSLLEELEPRFYRPTLPATSDFRYVEEVSEPSLFGPSRLNTFSPRLIEPSSPKPSQCSCCSCKSKTSSPVVLDDSFKQLINEQNSELRKLREQIEKLLDYQENLQQKTQLYLSEKGTGKSDECTQTTITEISPPKAISKGIKAESPCYGYQGLKTPSRSRVTQDQTEITLTFRDLHLETIVEQPQSPQPSVQVSIQEYSDFSRHLEDPNISTSCQSVMDQIQKLLNQGKVVDGARYSTPKVNHAGPETKPDFDVRALTMQRLRELGISFVGAPTGRSSHNPFLLPRVEEDVAGSWTQPHKLLGDSNQSIEMRMLERKYLGQHMKVAFNEKCDSAFSMGTRQYLERYGLGENTTKPSKTTQSNYPGKFLDSILLRDQPKFQ